MTLFRRVFTTPPKSTPIMQADVGDSDLDREFTPDLLSGIADPEGPLRQSEQAAQEADENIFRRAARDAPPETIRSPIPDDALAPSNTPSHAPSKAPSQAVSDEEAIAAREIAAFQERLAAKQRLIEASVPPPPSVVHTLPTPHQRHDDVAEPAPADPVPHPAVPPRAARRVRTRMLGFDQGLDTVEDPLAKAESKAGGSGRSFPVGWIVVVLGHGKGQCFTLFNGVSTIGRADDQTISLDLGDTSISREKHASIAYDEEINGFFLGHGGKSNLVRLNGRPVLSTETLNHGDTIRLGETTLRFAAFCDPTFSWEADAHADAD